MINSGLQKNQSEFNMADYLSQYLSFITQHNKFSSHYMKALTIATSKSLQHINNQDKSIYSLNTQKIFRKSFDKFIREELNKKEFGSILGDYIDAGLSISEIFGVKKAYHNFMEIFSAINKMLEPIRDNLNRCDSEVIPMNDGFQLLHYKPLTKKRFKTPILVVYSLINRHYILDLLPSVSIIRQFLKNGFDVYATDWTTSSYNESMTLEEHIQTCVGDSIKKVQEISGQQQVSMFGYCWGGIFSLIYCALYPHNVKNLILHATPVDLEKPDTVIENFTKNIDADKLVNTLGNVPGSWINSAFILRNPLDVSLKYSTFFSKPRSLEEIIQFFAIETWLYDSRPIIGEVFREIVNKIYKKNLLIKNKLKIGTKTVDLNRITMPVLNIIGLKDDLVPPESGRYIMCEIHSHDKKLIEFPTGHVGLCISKKAHERLWPEVTRWLSKRS